MEDEVAFVIVGAESKCCVPQIPRRNNQNLLQLVLDIIQPCMLHGLAHPIGLSNPSQKWYRKSVNRHSRPDVPLTFSSMALPTNVCAVFNFSLARLKLCNDVTMTLTVKIHVTTMEAILLLNNISKFLSQSSLLLSSCCFSSSLVDLLSSTMISKLH